MKGVNDWNEEHAPSINGPAKSHFRLFLYIQRTLANVATVAVFAKKKIALRNVVTDVF